MKNRLAHITATLCLLAAVELSAQPPELIQYQGRLMDGTNLVNGTVSMGFNLFTAAVGGTLVYADVRNVEVTEGFYDVRIGEHTAFGSLAPALTNAQVWLQVNVDGVPLLPRERLVAVPYALHVRGMMIDASGNVLLNADSHSMEPGITGAVVGGGFGNRVDAGVATVAGGGNNTAGGGALGGATVSGGFQNRALGQDSTVAGGLQNRAEGQASVISGGEDNVALSAYASVGGGMANSVSNAARAVISGGMSNKADTAVNAAVGGGRDNLIANSLSSVISGGNGNAIHFSDESTIGGGQFNRITSGSIGAAIGGGYSHVVTNALLGTIAGGMNNTVSENYATVGGGERNRAIGAHATVPGGRFNTAVGSAFAAGSNAKALHQGSFVWGDSQLGDTTSTQNDQVTFRATGGYRFLGGMIRGDDNGLSFAGPVAINALVSDDDLRVRGNSTSVMIESTNTVPVFLRFRRQGDAATDNYIALGSGGQMAFRVRGGDRMIIQTNGFIGIGTSSPANRLHVNGNVQATAFVTSSDREQKENIQPVHPEAILAKVADLPIATWRFVDDTGGTHLGPMAQDFYAAFGLGNSDSSIATVDADGVALAAIQALARRETEARARLSGMSDEVRRLQEDNARLQEMVRHLMNRVEKMEAQ